MNVLSSRTQVSPAHLKQQQQQQQQQWNATKRPRSEDAVKIEDMDDDLLHLANPPSIDDAVAEEASRLAKQQFATMTLKTDGFLRSPVMAVSWKDVHIKRIMGVGGFAVVSLARIPRVEKRRNKYWFAVKCMNEDSVRDKSQFLKAAKGLSSEAAMLSRLKHPNIIELYGVSEGEDSKTFQQPGGYFLVLQCMKGTLNAMLRGWRQLPNQAPSMEYRLSTIALQIVNGMEYLHENRVLYRDLKPQNVGIDYEGNVRLFDFGLSRHLPAEGTSSTHGCTGSLRYMAPEVLIEHEASFPSDVYSFSILLWELVVLAKPYRNVSQTLLSTTKEYMKAVGHADLRPSPLPVEHADLTCLIKDCWQRDPKQRPVFTTIGERLQQAIDSRKQNFRTGKRSGKMSLKALLRKAFIPDGKGRRVMSSR